MLRLHQYGKRIFTVVLGVLLLGCRSGQGVTHNMGLMYTIKTNGAILGYVTIKEGSESKEQMRTRYVGELWGGDDVRCVTIGKMQNDIQRLTMQFAFFDYAPRTFLFTMKPQKDAWVGDLLISPYGDLKEQNVQCEWTLVDVEEKLPDIDWFLNPVLSKNTAERIQPLIDDN